MDESKLRLTINDIGKNSKCTFQIKLKESIVSGMIYNTEKSFKEHSLTVFSAKTSVDKDSLFETTKQITRVAVFVAGLPFNQFFNTFVLLISSTYLIDILTLLQSKHFLHLYNIITRFTLSIDIRVKIFEDPMIEQYYDNLLNRQTNISYIIDGDALNYTDLKRILFILFYIILELNKKMNFLNVYLPYKAGLYVKKIMQNFILSYLTSDLFLLLFRRLILYKYLDLSYKPIKYALIDLITISVVVFKLLETFLSYYKEYYRCCENLDTLEYNFKYRVSASLVIRPVVLFCKNFALIICLAFLENFPLLLIIICSIITTFSVIYAILLINFKKSLETCFYFTIEICFAFIFINILLFNNSVLSNLLVLLGCIIKTGLILLVIVLKTNKLMVIWLKRKLALKPRNN